MQHLHACGHITSYSPAPELEKELSAQIATPACQLCTEADRRGIPRTRGSLTINGRCQGYCLAADLIIGRYQSHRAGAYAILRIDGREPQRYVALAGPFGGIVWWPVDNRAAARCLMA